jgi:hypothetical protein
VHNDSLACPQLPGNAQCPHPIQKTPPIWSQSIADHDPIHGGLVSFAEKEPTLEDGFMMVTKGLVT